jgi:8-oxo-dGTP pyrophosphatase MutT (NUDIX family)
MGVMETELKKELSRRLKTVITAPERISSAVLIPIFKKDGQYHILFIKRTNTVKTHQGQISFPGGAHDDSDTSLMATALREAEEEIGLKSEVVNVLGELDDVITTTSNFIVTPFVGYVPYPYEYNREKAEVARILTVPIAAFYEEGCLQPDTEFADGEKVASFAYHYKGQIIWGATARILHALLDIIARIPANKRLL